VVNALICRLLGHRDHPHYAATPEPRRLGVRCRRCLRIVLDGGDR
jgi:hypothetical protein